jgi:SAM-dependent methyltransferase
MGMRYFDKQYTKGAHQEVEFLTQLMGKQQRQKILDVGCGPGRHAILLTQRGHLVVGVDLSRRFLEIATSMHASGNLPANYLRADARLMPFANAFDWAICLCEGGFGIMETADENQKILGSIGLSLKSNGHLLLNVLNASYAFRHPDNDAHLDIKQCRGYWLESYTGENGKGYRERCSNQYFTVPEIEVRLHLAGMQLIDAWGCHAGHYTKRHIELDDLEYLVLARKNC